MFNFRIQIIFQKFNPSNLIIAKVNHFVAIDYSIVPKVSQSTLNQSRSCYQFYDIISGNIRLKVAVALNLKNVVLNLRRSLEPQLVRLWVMAHCYKLETLHYILLENKEKEKDVRTCAAVIYSMNI